MEFKNIKLNRESVEGRTITGYAAAFGNLDRVKDIIETGAFKKTLKERGDRIKVFYNHYQPLGIPLVLKEDNTGLYTESKVSKTLKGDEILELIKDGVVSEMSIAYETVLVEEDKQKGIRHLKELKLYEYGPVDFPANDKAIITGVKNLVDSLSSQDLSDKGVAEIKNAIQTLETMLKRIEPSEDTHATPLDSTCVKKIAQIQGDFFQRLIEAVSIK